MHLPRIAFALIALLAPVAPVDAQLEWRVSVKVFLDAGGNRAASGDLVTNAQIEGVYAAANAVLDTTGRGYRYRVTEIVELSGLSQWFSQPVSGVTRSSLQQAVDASPALYARSGTAMNVYVLGGSGGGWCARPQDSTPNYVSILGQSVNAITPMHEAGHVLGLCHTHGCVSSNNDDCNSPVSDEMPDTLPDCSEWNTADDIALFNYGVPLAALGFGPQQRVLDVWRNVMSYHAPDGSRANRDRLTPDQLDRMTDVSNNEYRFITDGVTYFVDRLAQPGGNGASDAPYASFTLGLFAALASPTEDIVLVRPGAYAESPTVTFPVTLRATRGTAVIGASAP